MDTSRMPEVRRSQLESALSRKFDDSDDEDKEDSEEEDNRSSRNLREKLIMESPSSFSEEQRREQEWRERKMSERSDVMVYRKEGSLRIDSYLEP
jgi:hypothetical protein